MERVVNAYCPTCGCTGIRWAGCDHDFHGGIPYERVFVCDNETDPVVLTHQRGPEHKATFLGGPPMPVSYGTRSVNPGPASDDA